MNDIGLRQNEVLGAIEPPPKKHVHEETITVATCRS